MSDPMTPALRRALLHRSIDALPDAAVLLVARLLALGTPGSAEVLGPVVVDDRVSDPGGASAMRPASAGELRAVAAEVWRVMGRAGR